MTEIYRTYDDVAGFEGPIEVEFRVTSWGRPSNYIDPSDPMEAHVTVAWYEEGESTIEFCPYGELDEWLMQKFYEDPPYQGDFIDDEPYY